MMPSEGIQDSRPAPVYSAPYRAYVYAACTLSAIVFYDAFGKDMASDTLHYHFYAGFSALNDRFAQDYFAAGPQSYFNPCAYVPFYVLVKMGLPGLLISIVLALEMAARRDVVVGREEVWGTRPPSLARPTQVGR
jgi:hypothetical protein